MSESPRAELAGTVHPADDAAGSELVGDALDEDAVLELFDDLIVFARGPGQLLAVDRRTPERVIGHIPVGIAEIDAIGVQRCAERPARIARRRRDEHALESGLGQNPRVRQAIERDAPGEAEI
jgi:hypothetical protein